MINAYKKWNETDFYFPYKQIILQAYGRSTIPWSQDCVAQGHSQTKIMEALGKLEMFPAGQPSYWRLALASLVIQLAVVPVMLIFNTRPSKSDADDPNENMLVPEQILLVSLLIAGVISIYTFIENVRQITAMSNYISAFSDPNLKFVNQCTDSAYSLGNLSLIVGVLQKEL